MTEAKCVSTQPRNYCHPEADPVLEFRHKPAEVAEPGKENDTKPGTCKVQVPLPG